MTRYIIGSQRRRRRHSLTWVILLDVAGLANAKEVPAKGTSDLQFVDRLCDAMVDKFVDRAFMLLPKGHGDFDNALLGKSSQLNLLETVDLENQTKVSSVSLEKPTQEPERRRMLPVDQKKVDLENQTLYTYHINRVKCHSCSNKITKHLQSKNISIGELTFNPERRQVRLQVPSKYVRERLQQILAEVGDYPLVTPDPGHARQVLRRLLDGIRTFYPLLLILAYITVPVPVYKLYHPSISINSAMQLWMGLFYLVFSFFKLLNLQGFVSGIRKYDYLAKLIPPYAYIYPWLEVALGTAYLIGYQIQVANSLTLAIFFENLVGVVSSVWRRESLECACLGSLLKLPLSYVTIAEDTLMILMASLGLAMPALRA